MEKRLSKFATMIPERLLPSDARKLEAYKASAKNGTHWMHDIPGQGKRTNSFYQFTYTGRMI